MICIFLLINQIFLFISFKRNFTLLDPLILALYSISILSTHFLCIYLYKKNTLDPLTLALFTIVPFFLFKKIYLFLLLVLIASVVLLCTLLWIKAAAKCLNVM